MDDVRVHRNSVEPDLFQAHAYTLGTEIHLAPGEEQHLAHEAWHVVQQKQGRVKPTETKAGGISINEDAGLEKEADEMGAKAVQAHLSGPVQSKHQQPVSQSVQRKVMQRKNKVQTGFGEFETTQFDDVDNRSGRGVDITLTFTPDKKKVDAEKIAISQSIRNTSAGGADYALGPTEAKRMVPSGKSGGGYAIDQDPSTNNPIYFGTKNLGSKEELKDTPTTTPATNPDDPSMQRLTVNYEMGYCFKKPGEKDKDSHPAMIVDKVRYGKYKGESRAFETAAFAIEGKDKDKYYGSVKWGYTIEGTAAAPKLVSKDIELASGAKGTKTEGRPTENFLEAAKAWNATESRGKVKVIADPANIHKEDGSDDTLAKDTEVAQIAMAMVKGEAWVKAAVVERGTRTNRIVYVKATDLKDMGSGTLNKPLPIPK